MGNKCSCLNDNNKDENNNADLSNKNYQKNLVSNKILISNDIASMNDETNKSSNFFKSNDNKDQASYDFYNNMSKKQEFTNKENGEMSNIINNYKKSINIINKIIRGYLLRKKYKEYLKTELMDFTNELYLQFISMANNSNVSSIVNNKNDSNIIEYLHSNWKEFYESDPTKIIKEKINLTKKYQNGLIIKYKNKSFHSEDIMECLGGAEFCYKGVVELYTNKKCGFGEIIYKDGSQKIGTFLDDEFEGWNTFIDKKGTLFVGLFKKGYLNGKGLKYTINNDHIYKGDFINNLRNGIGKDYRNVSKYEGEFKLDKKYGKGKILFKSGDIYEGDFKDNQFDGYGHYIWKKNGHEYKGYYKEGKFHGEGFYRWAENEYYKGNYKNGIKEGEGEIGYPDGKKFYVNFTNGKPNGIGIFEDKDGNKGKIQFIDGKINKSFSTSLYEEN